MYIIKMNKNMFFIFTVFFALSSFSQRREPSSRGSNKSTTSSKQNVFSVAILYSASNLKSDSLITARTMDDIGLSLRLKYGFSKINVGLYYDYILNAQKEDPASLNNSNMSSISSGLGVILGYKINDSFNFDLLYNLDYSIKTINKNSNGDVLTFKNSVGAKVLVSYKINPKWHIGASYYTQTSESPAFIENLKSSGIGLDLSYSLF
jgi:hypothetical protein